MEKTINPERGTLSAMAAKMGHSNPVVMINLLKFRDIAAYPDGSKCAGREAYATYSKSAFGKIKAAGGEVLYYGTVLGGIIAPVEESWDEVILVRYPSFDAFRQMISDAEYQKITVHRTAALEDSRLWLSQGS